MHPLPYQTPEAPHCRQVHTHLQGHSIVRVQFAPERSDVQVGIERVPVVPHSSDHLPRTHGIAFRDRDFADMDIGDLNRIGVIFQDFVRYQFTVGENIGVGDRAAMDSESRWHEAADKGMAAPFIEDMPKGYQTQLGRWFKDGRELSLGQWQKIALSRAFMRENADILVLDEPTASMDAGAEMQIFDRFREMTADQMAILISHRFSTVRMADRILVLNGGRVIETGDHAELMTQDGVYARLFSLQAAGYR